MARRRHKAILREAIQVNFLSPTRRRATVEHVHDWLTWVGVKTLFIEPGSPWENGYVESFNEKLCNKLFEGEIFYTLREAKIMIEKWRRHYNEVRPHSSLGYKPPAPETIVTRPNTAVSRMPTLSLCEVGKLSYNVV